MAEDKIRKIAERLGTLHSDCRTSSADAFGATVDHILREELEGLMESGEKLLLAQRRGHSLDTDRAADKFREQLAAEYGWPWRKS